MGLLNPLASREGAAPHPLGGAPIQVNHCRMPACGNFGQPGREVPGKPGPSPNRNPHYKVTSTRKGRIPALQCKCCGEKPPLKSNQGIAEELARLGQPILTSTDQGCTRSGCENQGKSTEEHPKLYQKRGTEPDTGRPRRTCKSCRRVFSVGLEPPRIHPQNYHLATQVFSRVVNKSPVRRTMQGCGIQDKPKLYYDLLKFIQRRCNRINGGLDRALLKGRATLPQRMHLATDSQWYTLNWTNRMDKRNPMFSAVCTVDVNSRYILGMHVNYDPNADSFAVCRESALNGDFQRPEAFRRYARYWLPGDEYHGGRAAGEKLGIEKQRELQAQLSALYAAAQKREDIEDAELREMHPGLYNPQAGTGMQVHMPYTVYAHCFLVRELLAGAGVQHVQYSMDCESLLRAAFLTAFREEVQAQNAHGFYARNLKYQTVPQREAAKQAAQQRLGEFMREFQVQSRKEAALQLMEHNVKEAAVHGKWSDRWCAHPLPTMNEPEKAVCHLTPNPALSNREIAGMALQAGLGAVDNVFQVTRRFLSALERPIGTSSGYNTVWHGYAPYNPAMVQRYLDLSRTTYNFCTVGADKKTPTMCLGLTDRVLTYDDVLWPGQEPPRPPVETGAVHENMLARWTNPTGANLVEADPAGADTEQAPPDQATPGGMAPGM